MSIPTENDELIHSELTQDALERVVKIPGPDAEWALRLRCAGQATAALGSEPATDLVATDLDLTTGNVLFSCGSQRHTVHTARDSKLIAALTIQ